MFDINYHSAYSYGFVHVLGCVGVSVCVCVCVRVCMWVRVCVCVCLQICLHLSATELGATCKAVFPPVRGWQHTHTHTHTWIRVRVRPPSHSQRMNCSLEKVLATINVYC